MQAMGWEENRDYIAGNSQEAPHVVTLSKMLELLVQFPGKNMNKECIWLRKFIWSLAMNGGIPNLLRNKSVVAIEVPKFSPTTEISVEILESANKLFLNLMTKSQAQNLKSHAAIVYESNNSILSPAMLNLNSMNESLISEVVKDDILPIIPLLDQSSNKTRSFMLFNGDYLGPSGQIFSLFGYPSNSWGNCIAKIDPVDKVLVDMRNFVLVKSGEKKSSSSSWFITKTACVSIAVCNPVRLNPMCNRSNLRDAMLALFSGDVNIACRHANAFESIRSCLYTLHDVHHAGTFVAANELMELCGFNPKIQQRKIRAISLACSLDPKDYEFFVVERIPSSISPHLVSCVVRNDHHLLEILTFDQFHVFSMEAAMRLVLDPQSESYIWKPEMIIAVDRLFNEAISDVDAALENQLGKRKLVECIS